MTETDELDVHALADGELSAAEKQRVQARLDRDPTLQRKYCQILSQKQLLLEWWHAQQAAKSAKSPKRKIEPEAATPRH